MPPADNCLTITGWVRTEGKTRCSPAGLPITRFTLEHHSEQVEAGVAREVCCRIPVLALWRAAKAIAGKEDARWRRIFVCLQGTTAGA